MLRTRLLHLEAFAIAHFNALQYAKLSLLREKMKNIVKSIRISQEQEQIIQEKMKAQGLSFTQYAINSMLQNKISKKKTQVLQNKELIIEIAKWGNNLNQIAKHLNTKKSGLDRVGLEMLGRIESHLSEIRAKYGC